jgi:hypothetical protein
MMAKPRPRKKPSPAKAKRVKAAHISSSSPKSISSLQLQLEGRRERRGESYLQVDGGKAEKRSFCRSDEGRWWIGRSRRAGRKALLLLGSGHGKSFAAIGIWREIRDKDEENKDAQKSSSNLQIC